MRKLSDIRLRWVLADPTRERAVDPLGMGAQADQIADRLLPDLSVQTNRARYLSFLCWAVQKSQGRSNASVAIHRLETKLALDEAVLHRHDDEKFCTWIGSRVARDYLDGNGWRMPASPPRLYKNTAFVTYRPLMRALNLLKPKSATELTSDGMQLASSYGRYRDRKRRCLSEISSKEKVQIRILLGLDGRSRSKLTRTSDCRRLTFESIRGLIERNYRSAEILEKHAQLGDRPSRVAKLLHCAFVWELVSCGLEIVFKIMLESDRDHLGILVRELRASLKMRPRRPRLSELNEFNESIDKSVALLRTAVRLHSEELQLDSVPFEIAALLVRQRNPGIFVHRLIEQHSAAKEGNVWIELMGDKIRSQKNFQMNVGPRSYRLDAFSQLVRELGLVQ
jgi:hypothetical protein